MALGESLRQFLRFTTITVTLLGVLLCGGPAFAQQSLVYINSNITTPGQNSVIVLVNDGNGNMSPLPGSPFLTDGTGVGNSGLGDEQWDAQSEVIINPEGTLLWTANGDTDTIAAFSIQSDGSLVPIAGSPFPSGGPDPISMVYAENLFGPGESRMVVVNKAADVLQDFGTPNYTTFSVSKTGALKMGQSYDLPLGSAPSQVMMVPGESAKFFGFEFMAGTVSSYKFSPLGAISQISSVNAGGTIPWILGAVKNPNVNGLYIGLPKDQVISVWSYNANAVLSEGPEVATIGQLPCWLAINNAGTVIYDTETPSGALSVFSVKNSHKPVLLQHLVLQGTGDLTTDVQLDPTEQFLYVLDRTGPVLHILNVNSDGTVQENITPYNLNLPAGTVPLGIAVLTK
jgi:DNA-binding beta-propeller fold protein YncE